MERCEEDEIKGRVEKQSERAEQLTAPHTGTYSCSIAPISGVSTRFRCKVGCSRFMVYDW